MMFKLFNRQLLNTLLGIRFLIAIIIGSSIFIYNGIALTKLAKTTGASLSIFDTYIYCSTDQFALSLCLIGIIVVLSDITISNGIDFYGLLRTSRNVWVNSKKFYIVIICIIYHMILALITIAFFSSDSLIGNVWGTCLANVSYDFSSNIFFPYNYILEIFSPLRAFLISLSLNCLYSIVIGTMIFYMNLKCNQVLGLLFIILFHSINYLIILLWNGHFVKYSLFGNSIFVYHNYNNYFLSNKLLSLSSTFILFLSIIYIFYILINTAIKKYNFT